MMQLPEKYLYSEDLDRRYSIKLGNLKISGNTIIWNLPPIKTCPGKGECQYYCYAAVKLHAKFKNVKRARETNYQHSKRKTFVPDLVFILRRLFDKYTYVRAVRLHEAGDFYNRPYLRRWIKIANEFPDKIFYTFTKSAFVQEEDLPDNFIVWFSYGGCNDGNYRHEDNQAIVIHPGESAPKGFYVCPTIGNPDKVCGRDCSYCLKKGKGRRVAFPLH